MNAERTSVGRARLPPLKEAPASERLAHRVEGRSDVRKDRREGPIQPERLRRSNGDRPEKRPSHACSRASHRGKKRITHRSLVVETAAATPDVDSGGERSNQQRIVRQ